MMEELKARWYLFKITYRGSNSYMIEASDCVFNYRPNTPTGNLLEKEIDKHHDIKLYEEELERRYPNLKFNKIDVYVKANGVFTGYTMDPSDKNMFSNLGVLDRECQLITEQPCKYTLCVLCQGVVPHDYVAMKCLGGVACKFCEATGAGLPKDAKWNQ